MKTKLNVAGVKENIYGNGWWQGVPIIEVKFAGCSVGCEECDSKHLWKKEAGFRKDPYELFEQITQESALKRVLFTGGEPLEQPLDLLGMLYYKLHRAGYSIHTETSGLYMDQRKYIRFGWWTVSPKPKYDFRVDIPLCDELLVVEHPRVTVNVLNSLSNQYAKSVRRILQPANCDVVSLRRCIELLPQTDDLWMLRLQTSKMIGLDW